MKKISYSYSQVYSFFILFPLELSVISNLRFDYSSRFRLVQDPTLMIIN